MNAPAGIDLTGPQREALLAVFGRHANRVGLVGVYGSRATGNARPGSDVDLVLYGPADYDLVATIASELEESDLSIFADVVAFDLIRNDRLRHEIIASAKPLFDFTAGSGA